MATRYFGERITRNEDPRLLTGRALFIDDVNLPGMLHIAFLRSPLAHARIRGIDVARARQRPGVVAVYTAQDLGDYWKPGPLLVSPPPVKDIVFNERTQVPLAKDTVHHLGEALAMVVAESRYIAEDAVNDIAADVTSRAQMFKRNKEILALFQGSIIHEARQALDASYKSYETDKITFLNLLQNIFMLYDYYAEEEMARLEVYRANAWLNYYNPGAAK